MKNPWEEIRLDTYEAHMSLDSVRQLQALNALMRDQLAAYPVRTAMILGVAGGNGLCLFKSGSKHNINHYKISFTALYTSLWISSTERMAPSLTQGIRRQPNCSAAAMAAVRH